MGIGINYQIHRHLPHMEWHLSRKYFGSGYGWIFPHSETASVGAYADRRSMSAQQLQKGLLAWATNRGIDLSRYKASAEYINYDYRGWKFGNIFLAGDAAGFASGLTGEGIYPAIVSGEHIASCIAELPSNMQNFKRLIRMQKLHARLAGLALRSGVFSEFIAESVTFGLRTGLVNFRKLEMAH
jgi:geranylgeranyl reductase